MGCEVARCRPGTDRCQRRADRQRLCGDAALARWRDGSELVCSDDKWTVTYCSSRGSFPCVVVMIPDHAVYLKILPCFVFQLCQMKKEKQLNFLHSAK